MIRRATEGDAEGIAQLLHTVVSERVYSAIDRAWTADEQQAYLGSLSDREAVHVAVADSDLVVGCQTLDLYSSVLRSMSHVAQLGTFILPSWRGQGVGQMLFHTTRHFALSAGYRKLVIQVRASNAPALSFTGASASSNAGGWRVRSSSTAATTTRSSWRSSWSEPTPNSQPQLPSQARWELVFEIGNWRLRLKSCLLMFLALC